MEEVDRRAPDIQDLEDCKLTVHKLHKAVVHGEVNKYNFLVTDSGVKSLDFETPTFAENAEPT